jgi:hypothetical protein
VNLRTSLSQRLAPRSSSAPCVSRWVSNSLLGGFLVIVALISVVAIVHAQNEPKFVIREDCQAFDISTNNEVVYAVPHMKRVKRLVIERDDIGIASGPGKDKRIVEADKFMPIPPVGGYAVNALTWSPDAQHIAADITLLQPPPNFDYDDKKNKRGHEDEIERERGDDAPVQGVGGGRAVALLDDTGREIKVSGSKTRFIENAWGAAWLADGSVVYLTQGQPIQIARVRPVEGETTTLFAGHSFDAVVWDAARNRAFAVGENLSLRGRLALVQLDLLKETVTVIRQLDSFQGHLTLSPSGTKVAFFEDGDTIRVVNLANPAKDVAVHAGLGRFQFSRDETRVLLKRGPDDQSGDLVWVGLDEESFIPVLHDLEFHAFKIAPDGESIAVAEPGKEVLSVYPLEQ